MSMKMSDISFNFSEKVVVVFGGSRGIGKEVCRQFMAAGAVVYCASRTMCSIDGVNNIYCDISKPSNIWSVFKSLDTVDFVINVAGTNLCEPIEKITLSEWDRLMDVNLKSFFIICKQAVEKMKQTGGRIVNVSSIAGRNKSIVSGVHYTSSHHRAINAYIIVVF